MTAWVCPDRSPIPSLLTTTCVPDALANPPEICGGLVQQLPEGGGVATRSPKGICELVATWVCPDRSPIPPPPTMICEVAAPYPHLFRRFFTIGFKKSFVRLLCIFLLISGHMVRWRVLFICGRSRIIDILFLAASFSARSAMFFSFMGSFFFCPFPFPIPFCF